MITFVHARVAGVPTCDDLEEVAEQIANNKPDLSRIDWTYRKYEFPEGQSLRLTARVPPDTSLGEVEELEKLLNEFAFSIQEDPSYESSLVTTSWVNLQVTPCDGDEWQVDVGVTGMGAS